MEFITVPEQIESRSMEIIAPYLAEYNLSPKEIKIFSRIIHASGDVEYAHVIKAQKDFVDSALTALKNGCNIYTDVEMVRTGINKKRLAQYGGSVECLIADEEVAKLAKEQGITRSMAAMRKFGKKLDNAIIAIGNAPTALFEVLKMIKENEIKPAAIIGIPVGFVGARESKDYLIEQAPVPYITVVGNKGGSPIAASVVNALLYMLD